MKNFPFSMFQHTAARRRLHKRPDDKTLHQKVSTHSRPKAAAHGLIQLKRRRRGFNTQPPEGGCLKRLMNKRKELVFQHTAARRRLLLVFCIEPGYHLVSTHSRPKAAATSKVSARRSLLGFNTQPPEGGCLWYAVSQ